MKGWLRWGGLVIFLVICLLIVGFYLLLADPLIRRALEKQATAINKARVEIQTADLTLLPLGLTLKNIQITNPDEPLTNAMEIGRIHASLESAPLLRRKIIIREMASEDIRFRTPRKTSGALPEKRKTRQATPPADKQSTDTLSIPDLRIPDAEEILRLEDLETLRLINATEKDITARRAFWQHRLDELPTRESLDTYQARIEALRETDTRDIKAMAAAPREVRALRDDIRRDLELLQKTSDELQGERDRFYDRLEQIKRAPAADARRLRDKYGPTPQGMGNVSRLLFGEQIGIWTERTLSWYGRLQPVIQRMKADQEDEIIPPERAGGLDIRFTETNPLPDFLIRRIRASATIPQGALQGTVEEITTDQHILGRPLLFSFTGDDLASLDNLDINGTVDRTSPDKPHDQMSLTIKNADISGRRIGSSSLEIVFARGTADVYVEGTVDDGILHGTLLTRIHDANLDLNSEKLTGSAGQILLASLEGVEGFSLKGRISGTEGNYQVDITSDLDQILSGSLRTAAKEMTRKLEQQLITAIEQKVSQPLAKTTSSLESLQVLDTELQSRIDLADSLLARDILPSGKRLLPF